MSVDYRWVQTRLFDLGFNPGPIDGVRGPRTDAAVVAFKRSIGLRARPYVGPLTLEALRSAPDAKASSIPWMDEAVRVRGLHEQRNTSALSRWFDASVSWIDPREIPWCGAFVATCFRKWQPEIELPENPLGARNWKHFGQPTHPVFGSCLIFWRGSPSGWKGHVGFYHGEDPSYFHVLGGNQRNAVTITRIAKERLLSSRWPSDTPISGKPVYVTPDGIPTTSNEA
ncbi:NlpC/P60 family protein [Ruegeria arenilitoris]|uniref:NlpC/P60 family protein n=1 Tax=Ruegeria arenilitoris TaxID=1173585 RepID=UPI00147F11C5|nr:TIGR02594 family protein [Ruegeria arenilitoris]